MAMTQDGDPQLLITKYIGDATRTYDIARDAFEKGIAFFKEELNPSQVQKEWIDKQTSSKDALLTAKDARRKYEKSKAEQGAVAKWASKLPDQIMHYSSIIDVFVSSHPEYAALAWGAIKFVLMGVIDHAKLFAKIAEALTVIGESLERAEVYAKIYSPSVMLPLLARLYGHVLLFLQSAVTWYNWSPVRRIVKSVTGPYEISYKETVDQIKLCMASIDTVADTAAKVEQRKSTLSLKAIDKRLLHMQDEFVKIIAFMSSFQSKSQEQRDLSTRTLHIVLDNNEMLHDSQLKDILQELDPSDAATKRLEQCRAVSRKRQSWKRAGQESIRIADTVQQWATSQGSSLLIARGSFSSEAKLRDLAVDIVNYGFAAGAQVVWSLSESDSSASPNPPSTDNTALWRTLVAQALKHDPTLSKRDDIRLSASQFQLRHLDHEWVTLFSKLASKLPICVVVIEASDLFRHFAADPNRLKEFFALFQRVADEVAAQGGCVKIAIMSYSSDRDVLTSIKADSRVHTAFVTRRAPANKKAKKQARKLDRKARQTSFFGTKKSQSVK